VPRFWPGTIDNAYTIVIRMGRKRKTPEASTSTSIRQKAYLCIRRKIATGELAADSALSELDLAKELGSSRTPIREAISQLIAEGLLVHREGGGVLVVQLTRESIIDLYELREALESYALSKVARLGLMRTNDKERLQETVDTILILKNELLKSGKAALNTEQMNRFLAADFNFHAYLMSLSQNVRIHKTVNDTRLLMRIFSLRGQNHDVVALDSIYGQHKDLLETIERQDAPAAVAIISEHIQRSLLERLEEFDRQKREALIHKGIPAFLYMYQPIESN
jgi:DNA-binding GntR family transcriptional regulator